MDKVAGQEIFDLENDKHVVKAYDKTNEQVDEVINKMIADQVPGFVAGNIFQRAWNSIKNFANEHPYLTAIIAVTALAVIATIITVTTFGVGAAPAAAAFGLGLTGIGSTAAGAAVIGFFTATAAAVATGATVAATAVATAVTTAVIVGLPLIAYGAVTGLLNLGGWLWDKTKAALSKTEEPKPITVKGSTLGIKRVVHKKESPSSSRSAPTSTDSDSEEQTLSGPFITDRKLATSEKEEEEKEESGKPVPPISGKSARI
jgi:hypothetical protein